MIKDKEVRIILIGNYPLDRQESMERFAQMLNTGFHQAGFKSEIWRPKVILGALAKSTTAGLGKWLGYLDKWIAFPVMLRWRLLNKALRTSDVHFHVCDHSNAPYLKHLPAGHTAITCHDVLAIRGAMGYTDAYCMATPFGKVLQRWILWHLARAKRLACTSELTVSQLRGLVSVRSSDQTGWRVIHNAFNAHFRPMDAKEAAVLLSGVKSPFLLHVGSGSVRKNRRLLLDMVAALGSQWVGSICFAGEGVDEALMAHAELLGLRERIISVMKPDHVTLVALYSTCDAFIFPSFSEGFGWPLIEAQACGAPVIASNIEPMPEVSGGVALHADPTKPQEFADAFLSLKNEATRVELIQRGFKNARRFQSAGTINAYLELHGLGRFNS